MQPGANEQAREKRHNKIKTNKTENKVLLVCSSKLVSKKCFMFVYTALLTLSIIFEPTLDLYLMHSVKR